MITPLDAQLCRDIVGYSLKFGCEDCIHFEQPIAGCSLGFQVDEHRLRELTVGSTIVFCKTFELG